MLKRHKIGAMIGVLCTAACVGAITESRVRAGLVDAGLSDTMAACMAKPMAGKLSIAQLRKLQSLGEVRNPQNGALSVREFLQKVGALQDSEIVAVTGKAALDCAF